MKICASVNLNVSGFIIKRCANGVEFLTQELFIFLNCQFLWCSIAAYAQIGRVSYSLEQLRSGEASAWRAAYRPLLQLGLRWLEAKAESLPESEREDVAQEAIIALAKTSLLGVTTDKDFELRFIKTLHRHFIDSLRRQRALKRGGGEIKSLEQLEADENTAFAAEAQNPAEVAMSVETQVIVFREIGELQPSYRDALLDHARGLSYRESAAKRETSEENITQVLYRARKALADRLRPHGIVLGKSGWSFDVKETPNYDA